MELAKRRRKRKKRNKWPPRRLKKLVSKAAALAEEAVTASRGNATGREVCKMCELAARGACALGGRSAGPFGLLRGGLEPGQKLLKRCSKESARGPAGRASEELRLGTEAGDSDLLDSRV